jgi:hypothetical protein
MHLASLGGVASLACSILHVYTAGRDDSAGREYLSVALTPR